MKKRIAVLGLLLIPAVFIARMSHSVHVLAQQTAYSQTISNQYGTFTNSVIVNYDPLAGSDGKAYVTEQLTGRPSSFMPGGVSHTPRATVNLGSSSNQPYIGNGVPANQSPNFSHMFALDLQGDCDQQFLDNGFCTGDGETGDFCPIAGALFINFLHGMEFEIATTTFQIPFDPNGGQQPGKVYCSDESVTPNPPGVDWPGLYQKTADKFSATYYRAQTGCFRFCANPPCTGQLWTCPGAVKQDKLIAKGGTPTKLDCTHKDAGYITGKNVTY